jgi:hypothetical protein
MVDGTTMARQANNRLFSLELCRSPPPRLSTGKKINEPNAWKQHTEPEEHPAENEDFPKAIRGVLQSTTLYHCQAA